MKSRRIKLAADRPAARDVGFATGRGRPNRLDGKGRINRFQGYTTRRKTIVSTEKLRRVLYAFALFGRRSSHENPQFNDARHSISFEISPIPFPPTFSISNISFLFVLTTKSQRRVLPSGIEPKSKPRLPRNL